MKKKLLSILLVLSLMLALVPARAQQPMGETFMRLTASCMRSMSRRSIMA